MLSTDRLTETVRSRGKDLIIAGADRVTGALRGHGKAAIFAGTALALAGAGSASAATVGDQPTQPTGAVAHYLPFSTLPAHAPLAAQDVLAAHTVPAGYSGHGQARAGHGTTLVGKVRSTGRWRSSGRPRAADLTWASVSSQLNRQANPTAAAHGVTPPADQLTPVPTYGPQNSMPLSGAQVQNAATIVRQALAHRMGIRSAVVAVATAMQESHLLDINYGTGESLGLFQQQPDMGWGSAQQIMNPVFASDAFLRGLAEYQAANPGWASQPLWQAAQSVQASGDPTAYAQWEGQAVQLVKQIAMHVR
jgi:hypothetical protein